MNTTHTPGPWGFHPAMNGPQVSVVTTGGKVCDYYDTVIGAGDKIIATAHGKSVAAGFPCVNSRDECAANAVLIAALPDLLKELIDQDCFLGVLIATVPLSEKDTHRRIAMRRESVRAAIAKATGE